MADAYVRVGYWFGWYDLRGLPQTKRDKYSLSFDQIALTDWGQQCLSILLQERPFLIWNKNAGDYALFVEEAADESGIDNIDINTFVEPLRKLLGEPDLLSLYTINPSASKGVFWFRIELPDHQVSRTVAIPASMTLNELHNLIQEAFEFDNDHLYYFYLNLRNPYSGDQYASPDVTGANVPPPTRSHWPN